MERASGGERRAGEVEGNGRAGYGRDFTLYAIGQGVSIAGDRIATIALVFLVLQYSGSFAPAVALFYVARVVPTLLAGLIVGALADQMDRRRLMISCDVGRVVLLCLTPSIVVAGLWLVYPVVVMLYALNLVFTTSARAALPDLVPDSRMLGANSILFSMQTAADVAYAVGGLLIFALGTRIPLYIDAATFAFSALMIALMHIPRATGESQARVAGFITRIWAGINYLLCHAFLKWSTLAYAFASLAIGVGFVLAPLYANDTLEHSPGLFGPLTSGAFRFAVLQVAIGVGAFLGSQANTRLAGRLPRGTIFGIGMTATGAADVPLAFTDNIYVATSLLFFSGLFTSLFVVCGMTLLQTLTPSELRGRVIAGRSTVIQSSIAVGSALAGVALLAVSAQPLWVLEGALFVTGSLFVWLRSEVRSQR